MVLVQSIRINVKTNRRNLASTTHKSSMLHWLPMSSLPPSILTHPNHPTHILTGHFSAPRTTLTMSSVLFLLLVLFLAVVVEAFLLPSRPASPSPPTRPPASSSRHQPSRPTQLLQSIGRLHAAVPSEGNDEAADAVDPATSSTPAVPKPFISRRMRRGPIGAAAASLSNKKKKAAEEIDELAAVAITPTSPTASVPSTASSTPAVLKLSKKWACVANCGACCYLAPSERPYLMDYFDDPEDLATYNGMTGDDGWCVHYDKTARACTVFEDRPWFCRVEGETFGKMYGVSPPEMDKFCTSCCREQIGDVYGTLSTEMTTFNLAIKHLKGAATATDDGGKKKGGGFGKAAQVKAQDEAAAASVAPVLPIDPFTGEVSTKAAAKADWI